MHEILLNERRFSFENSLNYLRSMVGRYLRRRRVNFVFRLSSRLPYFETRAICFRGPVMSTFPGQMTPVLSVSRLKRPVNTYANYAITNSVKRLRGVENSTRPETSNLLAPLKQLPTISY